LFVQLGKIKVKLI